MDVGGLLLGRLDGEEQETRMLRLRRRKMEPLFVGTKVGRRITWVE